MSWILGRILAYLFNSVSRQYHEVWASQFPFLHSLRDVIPPSGACLYGHINWSLAQGSPPVFCGSMSVFSPKRGWQGQAMDWVPFYSTEETCVQVARSLLVAVSPSVLLTLGVNGAVGINTPDVPESSASSAFSSSKSAAFQVGVLFKFFDQWRSITSNRFVLNMVQGLHLQLRSHPPLLHNFWQFNVKAAAAHHPIIQKEVDELLAKGAIEPSSGGAGFYSSVFVVPKHLLNLLNASIITPWKLHYLWGPLGCMPSAILGVFR